MSVFSQLPDTATVKQTLTVTDTDSVQRIQAKLVDQSFIVNGLKGGNCLTQTYCLVLTKFFNKNSNWTCFIQTALLVSVSY